MSATSAAAHASIQHAKPTMRAQITAFLERLAEYGATREEMERGTGMKSNTINPRMKELEEKGRIVNSGRVRPQSSGRDAVVWVLPQYGPPKPADEETECDV